ncbi:MAG: DUF1501 domain-containing protein [Verrucomicrobiaceae bacterium]|nr:DUF1501 domain-containing protein [Verrucomicrobiaceae bacterium]
MLMRMAGGLGMVGLSGMLSRTPGFAANPANAGLGNIPARAKRVIFLFLNGAPSHIDTFDPKPALADHEGKKPGGKLYKAANAGYMPSPLEFRRHGNSGLQLSESLPNLARVADDLCVIRSMHCDVPNHEPALLQMHTGILQPTRPSLGSWALYGLGSENENLPGYVVLRPSPKTVVGPALWSSGFLPAKYQAASVITRDMAVDKLLANIKNGTSTLGEQRKQLDLLSKINHSHQARRGGEDSDLEAHVAAMETAYRMQIEATDAFDVSGESVRTHEAYGSSKFAKSCLLARRLAERGVRFTTVYYTEDGNNQPWDSHKDHYKRHAVLCADAERAAAALISDLKRRGMLEETLVVFGGEFGRTPYMQKQDKGNPGRDHHHTAFSMMLAGGGIKGGFAHGQSDEFGMHAVVDPVHVHDLHATILYLLGIDHEQLTYRYAGRDFRLTDVFGKVVHQVIA